jgi:hypothetical protein
MQLNLWVLPENKQTAEDFLISELRHECAGTFDPVRTLNGQTVHVCSWVLPEEQAAKIGALMPDIIHQVDDFNDFGYLE